jgi:hypothetical protein
MSATSVNVRLGDEQQRFALKPSTTFHQLTEMVADAWGKPAAAVTLQDCK